MLVSGRPLSYNRGADFCSLRKPEVIGNGLRNSTISYDVTKATTRSTLRLGSPISSSWSPLPVTPTATPADDDDYCEVEMADRTTRVSFHLDDNSSGEDTISLDLLGDGVSSVDRRSRHYITSSTYGTSRIAGETRSVARLRWMALNRSLRSTGVAADIGRAESSMPTTALLIQRRQQRDASADTSRDTVGACSVFGVGLGVGCSEDAESDRMPAEFSTGSTSSRTQLTSFQTAMSPRHHAVLRLALSSGSRSLSSTSLGRPIVHDVISAQRSPADAVSSSSSPPTSRRFRFFLPIRGWRRSGTGNLQSTGSASSLTAVQTERKAIKVVGTMFVLFVTCWASFFVVNLTSGVCRNCHIDERLFKSFLWLGYASSTVNPIIYTIFNQSFKRTFIRILTCADCNSTTAV